MTVHRSFVRWKSGREEISFLSSPWLYRFFSSEDSASLALSGRGKRDKGERRWRGGVCYGRMWIPGKAFEVDCAEVAGHLVLYIYIERLHGTKYLSSKGRKDEFASWLKMPPFSTDIDPRRCSSRDYTRLDLDSLLSHFPPSDGGEGREGNICRTYETNSEEKVYRYLTFGKMYEKRVVFHLSVNL